MKRSCAVGVIFFRIPVATPQIQDNHCLSVIVYEKISVVGSFLPVVNVLPDKITAPKQLFQRYH
ncbi:TPA: hypothetical protein DIC40_04375 [Patescibacteria group bacterium]|nr:hypothetical protein [Candidatus Gracilibacteria bacterium]